MKRPRLLWYYFAASFIVIALVTAVLVSVLRGGAQHNFIARSEAQSTTEASHILQMFYYNVIAPQLGNDRDLAIADVADPMMMRVFADRTTFGLNITSISIFDQEGNLTYSTDPEVARVGESEMDLFRQAVQGTPSANLATGTEITGLDGERRELDVVRSYVAITDAAPDSGQAGTVLGVMRISQDVTDAFAAANADALRNALFTAVVAGGALFLVLSMVGLRGDRLIAAGYRRLHAQQEKLEKTAARLASSNAELEEFTYIVSHDLKEPLRGIEAFSGFLAEDYSDKLDEEGQRHISVLRESAVRMKDLIDDLLQLSRIGRDGLAYAPVSVGSLLNDVRRDLDFALQAKTVDLRIQPDLPTITCQKLYIREVFKNLISNAIKFSDKPSPVIEIGCHRDNGLYTFSVRDNGIGIDEKYQEKIFRIFQRLNQREDYEGTGVGLAICKKVVEAHQGKIWVDSEVGEGSTFSFTIPRTIQQTEQGGEKQDGLRADAD